MFDYIRENLDFDQLIWEFGDDNNPNWNYVSYGQTRKQKQMFESIQKMVN